MIKVQKMRRLFEAAKRDKTPERFFSEVGAALESKQLRPDDFSIRQLFENFVEGGREAVDSWNPRHGGGDGGVSMQLLEEMGAVTSGGFAKISGQIIYNAILDAYQMEAFVFSPMVRTIPTMFNGERIAGISRIADNAEIVDEGRRYPEAGVSEDFIDTPMTTKRGMIVSLTKEAVFFDRTNVLTQRCSEVGEFLGLSKEKRIIDAVIDENTTAARYKWKGTTYANFQSTSPWINLTTGNALADFTNIDKAEQTMAAITDPYTGEPILVDPTDLIVPRGLLYTARRIVSAPDIDVITPGYETSGNPTITKSKNPVKAYTIVSSNLLTARMGTKTSWYIGNINKAVGYMENWPLTTIQAPANSEVEFTNDIVMRWKSSERGAAAVLEPRYLDKSTVA